VLRITKFVDVASYAIDVIALFGLALAVDYSLLMVTGSARKEPPTSTSRQRWNARSPRPDGPSPSPH
jgi:hypothetical protein